jgi:hypothetical protein
MAFKNMKKTINQLILSILLVTILWAAWTFVLQSVFNSSIDINWWQTYVLIIVLKAFKLSLFSPFLNKK